MIEYLYQALASKYGIAIRAVPADIVRQRLYKARMERDDPDLNHLQFRLSPENPETELWITKGAQNASEKSDS